ncbi:MAG: protein kinase domain-containing protein [Planctomycetota bacterium]|jgi:serine/threonine protein kinase
MAIGDYGDWERFHRDGGYGITYAARHKETGRHVVVKFFFDSARAGRELEGIQAICQIRHPSLVEILDFGCATPGDLASFPELADVPGLCGGGKGIHFLVTGRVGNENLSEAWVGTQNDPHLLLNVARTLVQVLRTLGKEQCVHGDIRPQNIIFHNDDRQQPCLIDPSLAQSYRDVRIEPEDLDQFDPTYWSPERLGRIDAPIEIESDLYSLGLVLGELVFEGEPFLRWTIEERLRRLDEKPPGKLGKYPEAFVGFLRTSLQMQPGDRKMEFPRETPRPDHPEKRPVWPLLAGLAVTVAVVVAVGCWSWWEATRGENRRRPAEPRSPPSVLINAEHDAVAGPAGGAAP